MERATLGEFTSYPAAAGRLGFEPKQIRMDLFKLALTSGRLGSEVDQDAAELLWATAALQSGEVGSPAERHFYDLVLVPTLGFPLLDYLQFQAELKDLGVDGAIFSRQRTDFSLDTGRGLRLVIEVDGRQHYERDAQQHLDKARDSALKKCGWQIWRVQVTEMDDVPRLRDKLWRILGSVKGGEWGVNLSIAEPREREVMTAVWGATAVARIQFMLLIALQRGVLPSALPWTLHIEEDDTDVAELAIGDFFDWFGRLRGMYGLPDLPDIVIADRGSEDINISIAVSCTNPYFEGAAEHGARAVSRPANKYVDEPSLKFTNREYLSQSPEREVLQLFAQDFFRKSELREGQYEILSRILMGNDAVGLLPTGGGKSLTYQLASLLLPGATLYVAPLKSLLQDQFERLKIDGIDGCGFISSALNTSERTRQESRFAAGKMRMLQVAPERFLMENFRSLLQTYQANFGAITQVVVDECHCVSEWGHDFRPAYLSLSRIVRDRTTRLGSAAPVVALTGTASSIVLDDVRRELGILDSAAIVRANRLDRPELELQFRKIAASEKSRTLAGEVTGFLSAHANTNAGLLVFTQHVNGALGVFDIATKLANTVSVEIGRQVRYFSGERPKAISEAVTSAEWDKQKSQSQRDFINPRGDFFQILVATSAFGMGIDKPSIRKVIHYLSPQSPEAYYQEVGRAARDREPATAVMLFSDERAEITDTILSPETDISEARKLHQSLPRGMPVGDFLTTFFFHANRFTGVAEEVSCASAALNSIKSIFDKGESVVLKYDANKTSTTWNAQGPLEYSLVRLIHLGIVLDYTKDFNAKTFELSVSPHWIDSRKNLESYREYFLRSFEAYVRRYETRRVGPLVQELSSSTTFEEVEVFGIKAIIQYLYSQIERRRRTSTRTMLGLARAGSMDIAEARKQLLFYLQASDKFTNDLEELAKIAPHPKAWSKIARAVEAPAEVDELHGAAVRVLESYPTNAGLLFLSAVSRRNPTAVERDRSKEEFQAALKVVLEQDSADDAAGAAEEALDCCTDFDEGLAHFLKAVYGAWSYKHFGARFALSHAGKSMASRMSIVNEMLIVANQEIPERQV
ncbi:RecQ family ATP-dependent DNA helicase [Massilia aquatica]|nr:RecQ family ATP-dependent DNA helicase [Massilia aquatica]